MKQKPQNRETQDHTEKTACKKRNHKIHQILKKALRAALPAWRETTEHTEHTEKGLHVGKNHEILEIHQKKTAKRTASVGQQARRSRIPIRRAAGRAVTLHPLLLSAILPREHQ